MSKNIDQGKAEIAKLCQYFATNRHSFLTPGVKEAHVRQSLIDPFFEALGWDVRNASMTAPQYREVIPEDSLDVEGHQRAPDYTFRVGTLPKFYVEAKKCGVNISTDPAPAYQLRRYGFSAKLAFSILTDFEEFGVYDCSSRPRPNDKASHSRIQYLRFTEYPDRWREIWDVFSREAVWSGEFDKYATSKRKRGTSEVDSEFLKDIEGWRSMLARNIALRNIELSVDDLNTAVQRIIDRIIFLRMAEDRGLETYGQLLNLCERPDIYTHFIDGVCRKADEKYNSGLFHFQNEHGIYDAPDTLTPRLVVDDKILKPILHSLYFEHGSPYHFGALPVEILGTVYERFLGKVIRLTAGHHAKVEEKPEVRKAGGVYYTPSNIVNYIVHNTIGKQIEGKSPGSLAGRKNKPPFRVLDLACGSGSFLLGAYQYLLDHCLEWYQNSPNPKRTKAVYQNTKGETCLTITERKRILTTHIFGVDIDRQAVETTKLSLLLKALEGESDASLSRQMLLFHERALPNLASNIKCGNSLINSEFSMIPEDLVRVRAFDWQVHFPDAMKAGGFDAVIGNPPYLNIDDTWGKGDIQLDAIRAQYPEVYNDKTDLLFYFIAKAFELSKSSVGFIVSRAFLEAYKANRLRGFLASTATVAQIVDFQNYYVFSGVGITTCLLQLEKVHVGQLLDVYKLLPDSIPNRALSDLLEDTTVFEHHRIPRASLTSDVWTFASSDITGLNEKLDFCGDPLGSILHIGQGMQTGRNAVFGKRTLAEMRDWKVPRRMYRFRASNSDIQRFQIRDREEVLLYLEDESTIDKLPEGLRKHLETNSGTLKSRAAYKRGNCEWWKFTWPLHRGHYSRMRLVSPFLARENRFALVADDHFVGLTDTIVLFEDEQPESLKYLLGLLNSQLLTVRFRSIGKLKGGGIFEYFWNSVSKLPIYRPNLESTSDRARHDRMVALVDKMLELKRRILETKSESQIATLKNASLKTDAEIDRLVYELYGLTEEEVCIVERERRQ